MPTRSYCGFSDQLKTASQRASDEQTSKLAVIPHSDTIDGRPITERTVIWILRHDNLLDFAAVRARLSTMPQRLLQLLKSV